MEPLTFRRMLTIAHVQKRRGFPTFIIMQYLLGLKRGARFYQLPPGAP